MTTKTPPQAPGPGSLTWRYAGDPRILSAAGYALLLQLAHPTVASGVRDHSDYASDPWGRLLRSVDYLYLMAFGGQEAAENAGAALRKGHEEIRGEHADGSSYNAFEPAAWSWVHATLADAAITGIEKFARPLTPAERDGLWQENMAVGEIVGVVGLPDTWNEYRAYRDEMVATTLRSDVAIDDFLGTLRDQPLGGLAALQAIGLLPPALRVKCGLRWTHRQQGELDAFARASRALTPVMVGPLRNVAPQYLRWRGLPRGNPPIGQFGAIPSGESGEGAFGPPEIQKRAVSRDSDAVVTAQPAREGSFYVPADGTYDEAISPTGDVRPGCEQPLQKLSGDAAAIAQRINERAFSSGVVFNGYQGDEAFLIDPSPRVIEAAEWAHLEAGLAQRVKALDEFVADAYGDRRAVAEGAIPERVVDGADHVDPGAPNLKPPQGVWIGVAGLDVVRDANGEILVLEDNVRTPSGMAYAMAARQFVLEELGGDCDRASIRGPKAPENVPGALDHLPLPIDGAVQMLRETLLAAAPDRSDDDPSMVFLSDGAHNSAWWEHRTLSASLGIPLVIGDDLETRGTELWLREGGERPIDVVYRRTDACDSTSWVGELLGPALAAGSIGVINGFGTGVADDKLVHAYVEDLVRFYLGEEPLLRSVKTFDLEQPAALEEALDRVAELVVKPRGGSGGVGVVICPHAEKEDVQAARQAMASNPSSYVAQELVMLSTHPTVIEGELRPRHVDLRPFVFLGADRQARVLPGGLTRVAFDEGALIVNSSQNGGAKDTWVMGR